MFRFNLVNYIYLTLLKIKPMKQSIHCITLRTLDVRYTWDCQNAKVRDSIQNYSIPPTYSLLASG